MSERVEWRSSRSSVGKDSRRPLTLILNGICAFRSRQPRARMGGAIGLHQAGAVDRGVDLRRRQRGMAEQFLDRAQIAAAPQKMGGEGMAQSMRRRAVGQAERAAQPRDGELDDARRKRAALGADEQRPVRL